MLQLRCLLLIFTVLEARLLSPPYQTKAFLFVDKGRQAQLQCIFPGGLEDNGLGVLWYKRGGNGPPVLIKNCSTKDHANRLGCKVSRQEVKLMISKAQKEDSGLYLCAHEGSSLTFSNGSSLIVGESYTPNSQVTVLERSPQLGLLPAQGREMACVVHGAANFIQISWNVSRHLQKESVLVRNASGLLTFVNVVHIPPNSDLSRKSITCEVRFNLSGPPVRKYATFAGALEKDKCVRYSVPLSITAAAGLLAFLFAVFWIHFRSSRAVHSWIAQERAYPTPDQLRRGQNVDRPHQVDGTSSIGLQDQFVGTTPLETLQEGLFYASLQFPQRAQEENNRMEAASGSLVQSLQ